jgi:hypothetical protein
MKRGIYLYLNSEDYELAKSQGLNVSAWFREMLSAHLDSKTNNKKLSDNELIKLLKTKNGSLALELKIKTKEVNNKNKEITKLKTANEKLKSLKDEIKELKKKKYGKKDTKVEREIVW